MTSVDPLYQYERADIRDRIAATYGDLLDQTRRNGDTFVWDVIRSVDELGAVRQAAMQDFLDDYDAGRADGRYVNAALPVLPFEDDQFDLALCSHLLFLYGDQLDETFHLAALNDMGRVAREVRVFPLLALSGAPSPHVDRCVEALRGARFDVTLEKVPYEFQRGGDHMMRIRRPGTDGARDTRGMHDVRDNGTMT